MTNTVLCTLFLSCTMVTRLPGGCRRPNSETEKEGCFVFTKIMMSRKFNSTTVHTLRDALHDFYDST